MRDLDSFSFSGSFSGSPPPVCIGEGGGGIEVVIWMGILFCCRKICNCSKRCRLEQEDNGISKRSSNPDEGSKSLFSVLCLFWVLVRDSELFSMDSISK